MNIHITPQSFLGKLFVSFLVDLLYFFIGYFVIFILLFGFVVYIFNISQSTFICYYITLCVL